MIRWKLAQQSIPLYQQLRIFQNLFQPSMKLSCKIRKGSRVTRRYDWPATPLQQVLQSAENSSQIPALKSLAKNTDPFELSRRIDQQLDCPYNLAAQQNSRPREKTPLTESKLVPNKLSLPRPRAGSAWRNWTFTKNKNVSYTICKDKFARMIRSDFHMTQRILVPVRFLYGLTRRTHLRNLLGKTRCHDKMILYFFWEVLCAFS